MNQNKEDPRYFINHISVARRIVVYLFNRCCCSKPISYLFNLNLNILFNFSILNKYYKSLHPSNTISLSANFCNIYFIFLAYLNWFWSRRTSVETSISTSTVTPTSAMPITTTSLVTHSSCQSFLS